MCGIAGAFNLSLETVTKMAVHQGSRGPDHMGFKKIDNVIFAHNRLSIIDKSERSNQPMSWVNGQMLSYNGEIYNYDQSEISDTEWLFKDLLFIPDRFYEKLDRLNGMFAFAWYEDGEIHLVRDRFGIKPLYYTHQKDYFAFASTPAAVALTKPHWQISEKGLQEYLSLGATMLHSMYEGIIAVPPGHYVTFNCKTNEVKVKRWYYPKFIENALETIEGKVIQAIDRVKLTCDWPQIILLSGGLDSTLVASRYSQQDAIHLASPEQDYAQKVADKFNINLRNVHPSNYNAEECLTDYITQSGDPTMAGLIPYITCKEIKKQGFRVAITANGADELFFGYNRMQNTMEQRGHIFREFSFIEPLMKDLFKTFQPFNTPQWFEICTYLMFDLNKTLDFASMCHSVEVRVPYLDHELVEAALSIPMSEHVGQYGNKTILKKMLAALGFDWGFIHRPKVGFSLHFEPNDLQDIKNKAMAWYKRTDYPQLPQDSTPRQEAYHQMTVLGLHLWHKINKKA
jgi:asparagine synthase (glutamine-hydrolysing)